MKNILFVVFILSLSSSLVLRAQGISSDVNNLTPNQRKDLRHQLANEVVKKMNVSISCPNEYSLIDSAINSFDCDGSKRITSPAFVFVKKDHNVLVTIALMARDSVDDEKLKLFFKRFHPELKGSDANPDSVWRNNFKARADTINFKYEIYNQSKLKSYKAGEGAEFCMTCPNLFLNDYQIAKALTLVKKYRGIIDIYYFTRKGVKVDVTKEVQKFSKSIRYN